ncbi:phosphate ABC transporter ATP-binding protein [Alicyclobacillus acidoterrestris]|uniref:Phosphate ABC transporter ATP-binding protein n=1 Tax=Alicyclobacillus acidoterrestris (strain ATCC 49025 / DSM 3922 / CIP 106132 / NCIMB 13137 / GD3B) TaxID=1356854 RepID=T0BP86_ALIAG|nr:phosphate ABC transporter ATP-binding protein [Alicyclobacillus acidoterrestris]EPZ42534.1 hypothetical protein N007_01770 [Alicyclobacillus acidoterrestris ATCC 49025]UNO49455.1 phosphate ABC transporter ATP-binding protein [Alicyclobacillus acidoterrestris]
MDMHAIEFVDVSLRVGEDTLLRKVDGRVPKGRIVALIGPSGSGKSTLLSMCNLMRTPTSGEVYVEGREVRTWPVRELRQKVAMVFQSPTMFPGTVADNLSFGLRLHGLSLSNPAELLEDVGLDPSLLDKRAEDLSGGQKQRVALGRTLAMQPEILLLDEVTSALDVHAKLEVERTILSLHESRGTSMLWVTHDLAQARRIADIIFFMDAGELVEVRDAAAFFNEPQSAPARRFLETMREGDEVQ